MRPDSADFPLLVHILGASVLVGSLVLALVMLLSARDGAAELGVRLGFRTLLIGALPSYVVMRAGAEWVKDKEHLSDDQQWLDIGYMTADGGLLLLIIATVLAGLAVRRAQAGTGTRIAAGLVGLLIVAYGVAIWAMTTKPL